jgi:hypothetical protein
MFLPDILCLLSVHFTEELMVRLEVYIRVNIKVVSLPQIVVIVRSRALVLIQRESPIQVTLSDRLIWLTLEEV